MSNFRIVPKNHHDYAALSTSGSDFGTSVIQNTQNSIRNRRWTDQGATNMDVLGTWEDGQGRMCSFFGAFLHTFHGANIRFRGYSDSNWTTQVVDTTVQPAIWWTPEVTGLNWGPTEGLDPFLTSACYKVYFSRTSIKSYKISLSSFSGTYGADRWSASRFWVGNYHEMQYNPDYGSEFGWGTNGDHSRSLGGSLRTTQNAMWRTQSLDLNFLQEADQLVMDDIIQYCGTSREIVLDFWPDLTTRKARDMVIAGKLVSLDAFGQQLGYLTSKIHIEQS